MQVSCYLVNLFEWIFAMSNSSRCALCSVALTSENKTKEHIIPNSIGGIRKVTGFICRTCNSVKGNDWDSALAEQFHWISLMVGVVRDRGEVKPKTISTISGKKFNLLNDGSMTPEHPVVNKIDNGGNLEISISARDLNEAKNILQGLRRKFPNINKEVAIQAAQSVTSYLNEPLTTSFEFGGPLSGRSVIKTALAFSFDRGIDLNEFSTARNFLSNSDSTVDFYGLFYLKDLINDRKAVRIFHCVAIYGDVENKKLLAYVEYFGLARWLIVLNDDYQGKYIEEYYAIDPTTGAEIDIDFDWSLTFSEINAAASGNGCSNDKYLEAINEVMKCVMEISEKRGLENAMKMAWDKAVKETNIKNGEEITSEFIARLTHELLPFFTSRLKRN